MWFRRDLRLADNAALAQALARCAKVHCLFVFDREILDPLARPDRRVDFILASLQALDESLRAHSGVAGAGLIVCHAVAADAVEQTVAALGVQAVFANHDDEPQALRRDTDVCARLTRQGVAWHSCKDHVVFERRELLTATGQPYRVFTPYKNAWLKQVTAQQLRSYGSEDRPDRFAPRPGPWSRPLPDLQELGFSPSNLGQLKVTPGSAGAQALLTDFLTRIDQYQEARNFPALKGPSYLSVHLRFGTISIRALARAAHPLAAAGSEGASVWLSELIWRDFYAQILSNFPHVVQGAFKPEYDRIEWEEGERAQTRFAAWCQARTGYPLVDAAMEQLNRTGYMHNRLRMVVASFLVKDLGLDWRWGERYFAEQLIDFDLSANNGGWQWASSSGCDAQPYFRIFNPTSQSEKFDAHGKFIRRYLPQLAELPNKLLHAPWKATPLQLTLAGVVLGNNYPRPIVEHDAARARTLLRYGAIRSTPAHSSDAPD
jgi:deoxyribodipyrimidine photo-lyase